MRQSILMTSVEAIKLKTTTAGFLPNASKRVRCDVLNCILFVIDAIRDSARPCSRYSPTGHSASL